MLGRGSGPVARGRKADLLRRVGVGAAACVLGAACGAGDDTETSAPLLPDAVCALLDRLDDREDPLEAPEVFDLDAAALAEALAARRDVLADLTEATRDLEGTDGELHTLLKDRTEAQPAVDEEMLDDWDADRLGFSGAADTWVAVVVGEEVRADDGTEVDVPRYWRATQTGYERLVVGCRAPHLAAGPPQETSQDAPAGRIAFRRPAPGGAGTGSVVVTTERGTDEQELPISEAPGGRDPRTWGPLGGLDVSPGADPHLLVNVMTDDEYATVVVDLDGTIVRLVQRSTQGPIACPAWDAAGRRTVALLDSHHADERRVAVVDPDSDTAGPVSLPFWTVGCSDFISDDRIVVSNASLAAGEPTAVWTVGLDGSDPQELYRADGCGMQVGSVDPAATRVALAQVCDDPRESGIVVVDLATGEARRVVTGGMGTTPKWSPDGEWLVFGYAPLGEGPAVGTWVARADGSQLREVVPSPAWFPVWLPPA